MLFLFSFFFLPPLEPQHPHFPAWSLPRRTRLFALSFLTRPMVFSSLSLPRPLPPAACPAPSIPTLQESNHPSPILQWNGGRSKLVINTRATLIAAPLLPIYLHFACNFSHTHTQLPQFYGCTLTINPSISAFALHAGTAVRATGARSKEACILGSAHQFYSSGGKWEGQFVGWAIALKPKIHSSKCARHLPLAPEEEGSAQNYGVQRRDLGLSLDRNDHRG